MVAIRLRQLYDARWAYLFIAPAYIPFLIFILWPLLQGLQLSLYDADLAGRTFTGLANFRDLFEDESFRRAIVNTFFFVGIVVPSCLVISLFVSVMVFPLSRKVQSFFRMAFYLPVVASGVILAMVWLWIYNTTFGLLNHLLSLVGLPRVAWLASTTTALPSLAVVVLSWVLGQPIVLFMAALGGIPDELYDAAKIDGASGWQEFWRITLPLLRPTMLFVLVTQTLGVFQVFVVVLLMTRGGPAYATQTIVYSMYQTAFQFWDFGHAAAMGVVLLAIVSVIAFIQFRFLGQEIEY